MNQILTEKSYNSISELPLELRYKIFQYLHIDTKLEILSSRARNEYMNSIFSYYSLEEYYNLYNYVCNVFTDPVLLDKLPKYSSLFETVLLDEGSNKVKSALEPMSILLFGIPKSSFPLFKIEITWLIS